MAFFIIVPINGAVAMCDMQKCIVDGEYGYQFPPMDTKYKYLAMIDDMPHVSEDLIHWGVAIAVLLDGETIPANDIHIDMLGDRRIRRNELHDNQKC